MKTSFLIILFLVAFSAAKMQADSRGYEFLELMSSGGLEDNGILLWNSG